MVRNSALQHSLSRGKPPPATQHVASIQHVAAPRNQWLEIAYLASLGSCYEKWMYVLQPYHTFAQQDPVTPVSDKAWLFLGFVQQRLSQKRLQNLTT